MAKVTAARLLAALIFVFPAGAVTWKVEAVDLSGPGRFSSMKIDRDGNAHVAYIVNDGSNFPLKYAYWDHRINRWAVMPVAGPAGVCSLTLDSKQRPHIIYGDAGSASGAKLRRVWWSGDAWVKEAIPLNSDIIAYYNSIAMDANDHPTISFYEYRGPKDTEVHIRLRNVAWNGQYWQVRTVDPQEGSGKFNSIAVDANGRIHIAYANVSAGTAGLRYAYSDNGTDWKIELVDGLAQNNGEPVGYSVFIAIDKQNNPHVTYVNQTSPALKYAVRRNGRWTVEVVDDLSAVGYPDRNSLAFDDSGRPYISYYDAGRGELKLAHKEGSRWLGETVDSNGSGFTSSLQIVKGIIWVSYADDTGGVLKVARREVEQTAPAPSALPETAKRIPER